MAQQERAEKQKEIDREVAAMTKKLVHQHKSQTDSLQLKNKTLQTKCDALEQMAQQYAQSQEPSANKAHLDELIRQAVLDEQIRGEKQMADALANKHRELQRAEEERSKMLMKYENEQREISKM
eukprot:gene6250-19406_t